MFLRYFSTKIMKAPITVTHNAWDKIKDIVDSGNGLGMLFSVVGGGCNGFNYKLELMDNDNLPTNLKIFTAINHENCNIYIEPTSEMYLLGTTVDYHLQNYKKNIYESKFVFDRDKKDVSSCGCGVSFVLKE